MKHIVRAVLLGLSMVYLTGCSSIDTIKREGATPINILEAVSSAAELKLTYDNTTADWLDFRRTFKLTDIKDPHVRNQVGASLKHLDSAFTAAGVIANKDNDTKDRVLSVAKLLTLKQQTFKAVDNLEVIYSKYKGTLPVGTTTYYDGMFASVNRLRDSVDKNISLDEDTRRWVLAFGQISTVIKATSNAF